MNKRLAFLLPFLFLYACSTKQSVPKDILPPAKMQSILWDTFRADEMALYYQFKDSSYARLTKREELYQKIFQVHHITKDQFKRSLQFYQSRPDLLKTILDSLQKQSDKALRQRPPDSNIRKVIHPI